MIETLGNLGKPVLLALVFYAVVALILTRGVIADPGLSGFQKIAQTMIIWLIPVIGMSVVLLMQGNSHTRDEMKRLVPFPFYLTASSRPGDGSLAGSIHDTAVGHCGADAGDAD